MFLHVMLHSNCLRNVKVVHSTLETLHVYKQTVDQMTDQRQTERLLYTPFLTFAVGYNNGKYTLRDHMSSESETHTDYVTISPEQNIIKL